MPPAFFMEGRRNILNNYEKVVDISKQLDKGVKEMYETSYKEFLDTMGKFYHYSYNNCLLIHMQCPTATYVASYGKWKKDFDRQVRKGEKGIKIIAPCLYKSEIMQDKKDANGRYIIDANGNSVKEPITVQKTGYKVVSVFDYAQTTGEKQLPEFGPKQLQGDVKDYGVLLDALKHVSPVPIIFEVFNRPANGYFSRAEQKIVIQPNLPPAQTIKTLIHEISHSICDAEIKPGVDRATREVRAESISYLCTKNLLGENIDPGEYTFPYVAGWSSGKDLPELKQNLKEIQSVAAHILDEVEKYIQENTEELQDALEQINTEEKAIKTSDAVEGITAEELTAEPVHISRSR